MLRTLQDIWDSRQPSTTEKYCYSLRNFFAFCQTSNIGIKFPVQISTVAKYLAFLRGKSFSKSSIGVALVSLKWVNGFFPTKVDLDSPFLRRMVESAQRNIPAKKNQKLPFTRDMIQSMMIVGENPSLEELRNALIPSLSFSLLLRNDELIHLTCRNIGITHKGLSFKIDSSKTDTYRKGYKCHYPHDVQEESTISIDVSITYYLVYMYHYV